jgi:hypothetical protein
MAKHKTRRRTPPKRALIGPLVMLASGMAVGLVVWRFLMLEPPSPGSGLVVERLSRQDREALDRLLK